MKVISKKKREDIMTEKVVACAAQQWQNNSRYIRETLSLKVEEKKLDKELDDE
jgi:hypothetical protein